MEHSWLQEKNSTTSTSLIAVVIIPHGLSLSAQSEENYTSAQKAQLSQGQIIDPYHENKIFWNNLLICTVIEGKALAEG